MERRLSKAENLAIVPKYNSIMTKLIESGVAKFVPQPEIDAPEGMIGIYPIIL